MARVKEKVFEMPADDALSSVLPLGRSSHHPGKSTELVSTPLVATLVEFDAEDRPLVRSDALHAGERLVARATVALDRAHLGHSVVLLCENGDPSLPIIVGVISARVRDPAAKIESQRAVVQADDDRYVIEGQREVVLRCGASSITLTRAGKVIIKGTYVLSRSSGYNKIKGAAVDIN